MWAPAADARIDPALRHDVATVMRPTLAPTGSEQPHADHDPTQVAEPESDPADHVTAEHALHDAALASVESGDVREPSFTAWPASGMQVEPEQPSPAVATDPDEPTLPDAASSSWEADLEPRFGASEPEASTGMPGTGTSEPFDAVSAADRPQTMEPFATTADGERFAVVREERAREPSRIVWRVVGVFAALVLAVLLIAQLAWWQRETVMVYWPGSQPMFARVCEQLGCQISPPRDIDGLQVEPSDLRQVDGPHRLELRVPLRNRYNVALAYPAMELTLLDDKNNIAIRRVLWPQDYVRAGTPIAAGLPAGATQTMIVRLDTGTAVASNFRVQIFYP